MGGASGWKQSLAPSPAVAVRGGGQWLATRKAKGVGIGHYIIGVVKMTNSRESSFDRVQKAMLCQEPDRAPYLEYWIGNQPLIEHVLERRIAGPPINFYNNPLSAKDSVEFSQRIGMDAVVVDLIHRPNTVGKKLADGAEYYLTGNLKGWSDLSHLDPPPDLAWQRRRLEEHIEAVQGTKLGIVHTFTGVVDPTYLAMGLGDFMIALRDDRKFIEHLMDTFTERVLTVMEMVCEYDEVGVILMNDDVAHAAGMMISPELMRQLWYPRMERLIQPAKQKGKLLGYHSDGKLDELLPMLVELGFHSVHPVEPYGNDIYALKEQYAGRMCLVGNIDISLLTFGTPNEIRADVTEHLARLAPGGGYIVSSCNSITTDISPENFLAMTETVRSGAGR